MTDPRARRVRRPPDRRTRCSRASAPRRDRRAGPAARLPRHGARRRQDVPDARGGPPTRWTAARTSSSASSRPTAGRTRWSCSTASRSCPRRRIEYRGVVVEEMDTDAIIARRPTVALIDELAHTNVPGSARAKRWEDVEVIRDAGIHVVSTLNVQHLESVADAVATITGAPVNERLPDEVLLDRRRDRARRHEPARAPPADEARQRLPARTRPGRPRAFFTEANLTALRELAPAARRAAGRGPARGHDRRVSSCRSSPIACSCSSTGAQRRRARSAGPRMLAVGAPRARSWRSSSRRRRAEHQPFDRPRDLQEALDDAVDLGAEVVRVEAADVASGRRAGRARSRRRDAPRPAPSRDHRLATPPGAVGRGRDPGPNAGSRSPRGRRAGKELEAAATSPIAPTPNVGACPRQG